MCFCHLDASKPSRDTCTDPYEIYGAVLPELCKGGYSGPEWPHTPLSDMTLSRMLVDQFFSIPGDPGKAWPNTVRELF